jgi:hypothetical protein
MLKGTFLKWKVILKYFQKGESLLSILSILAYPMESLKRAFYQIAMKKKNAKVPGAKSHGNCAFTLHEEVMVIGYLQMRSYLGSADQIQGILTFFCCLKKWNPSFPYCCKESSSQIQGSL